MPARAVVICFDALDKDLVQKWAASGHLPTFAALFDTCLWAGIENPRGLYAGTVWSCFNTGLSPAGHGRFFRRQAKSGDYLDHEFLPDSIAAPFFWELLSEAGKRVAVLNVPMTAVRSVHGVQLIDWSAHEPNYDPPLSSPPEFVEELTARHGRPRPDHCDGVEQTEASFAAFSKMLEARIQQDVDIYTDVLQREDWDLFVAVFGAAHCVGHQAWHLHDPAHPRHDAALVEKVGDPVLDIYRRLDRALADVIERAGDDATLLVMASHGMGGIGGQGIVLDEILRRIEGSRESAGFFYRHLKRAWYTLPAAWRGGPLQSIRQRAAPSLHESLLVPDRIKRRYFAVPSNSHAGAVRINLAGREAHGVVQPGADYDRTCAWLEQEMLALVDAETGRPVVRQVYFARHEYDGPHLDDLPDVLIEWDRSKPVRSLRSERVGTLAIPALTGRTGDHLNHGMLWARTAEPGAGLGRSVRVIDIAPTLAAILGVACDTLEGESIGEIIERLGSPLQ